MYTQSSIYYQINYSLIEMNSVHTTNGQLNSLLLLSFFIISFLENKKRP